jgi:hypothetical protein
MRMDSGTRWRNLDSALRRSITSLSVFLLGHFPYVPFIQNLLSHCKECLDILLPDTGKSWSLCSVRFFLCVQTLASKTFPMEKGMGSDGGETTESVTTCYWQ